ncbi:MAG TPA: helix-turn-helix domain-containing protein [Candidatus Sulfotelmatobacter sp.]|nr:helix-turn-helix domain-containing protein [Candidatus Sulfotelmatobacter sp.]
MTESAASVAERLTQLGFSQYEARTYVGLLMSDGATGYSVANETGVPQPKVYETLRRLVERGAAMLTGERPARYAAVPPAALLSALEKEFAAKVEAARTGLEGLPDRAESRPGVALSRLNSLAAATERAAAAISGARSRVYMSGRGEDLKGLARSIDEASERGVQFVIVHFGPLPFSAPRGKVMRHASTEGTLYSSRKAHHLAVVVDSKWALWALARDGREWEVMQGEVPLVASLVKSYIRHDLFVQRMYADLPNELEALYGPGLLQLTNLSPEDGFAETGTESVAVDS